MKETVSLKNIFRIFGKNVENVLNIKDGLYYSGRITLLTKDQCEDNIIRLTVGGNTVYVELYSINEDNEKVYNEIIVENPELD